MKNQLPGLRRRLLAWFDQNRRDLPWRRDRDPYRIWVSEVMLQQTQVAAVVPFFERFLAAFPTVADLAQADEQEVLRLWEGLGYYRRARNLHQAARRLVAQHGGRFPDDPQACRALPGIGRYMAGAILSQAFDRRLPIVEANSLRVFCRLFGQRADPRRGPASRWLWRTAEDILPKQRAGDFNQALMELGALVCTPKQPKCGACPLAGACAARRLGLQEKIPLPAAKPAPVEVHEVAVVVRRARKVLLVQRPDQGRWSRMWEFPHGDVGKREKQEAAARRVLLELTGLKADLIGAIQTLRHSVTHHRITLTCFTARHRSGRFRSSFYTAARWVTAYELHGYPVSVPQRKLTKELFVAQPLTASATGRTNRAPPGAAPA